MNIKNKWNSNKYTVKSFDGKTGKVTLIREDGSEFIISQKEYKFSYREVRDGKN